MSEKVYGKYRSSLLNKDFSWVSSERSELVENVTNISKSVKSADSLKHKNETRDRIWVGLDLKKQIKKAKNIMIKQ